MKKEKIRVLFAKMGLDGHDRGLHVVAAALRDAGMEVIYLGLRQSPEQICAAAIQEDVDIVGVSSLSDAHCTLVPKLLARLKESGAGNIPVILGGFIQPEDISFLKEVGVSKVFSTGCRLDTITNSIREIVSNYRHIQGTGQSE